MMITLSMPCGHFIHLLKSFILHSWLVISGNCLKWRFVPKRGRVADGCLVSISWLIDAIFCKVCKMTTKDSMRCAVSIDAISCKFPRWLITDWHTAWHGLTHCMTRIDTLHDTDWIRERNPWFFMPLFGQKTGVRARMNEIKSGIPCSGIQSLGLNWLGL